MEPLQATQALRTGFGLQSLAITRHEFEDGRIGAGHARVIADTTRHLNPDQRDRAERLLVEAAKQQDPVALGRTARRLLAEFDHEAATAAEDRRHARRYARIAPTEDGMVSLHANLAGLDAEVALTAIDAFRTPD
ncbi:MAG: 13E12 repeat family protein, partial [Actinomycetota bacterium]|nr:13E12 repeat family protein [Actinomycetota bacterium]